MKTTLTTKAIAIVLTIGVTGITPNANASHGSSAIACEADGSEAGRDGPFNQELYEQCGEVGGADAYYEGFIEGCMSVEGNTKDVCESATDADDSGGNDDSESNSDSNSDSSDDNSNGDDTSEEADVNEDNLFGN